MAYVPNPIQFQQRSSWIRDAQNHDDGIRLSLLLERCAIILSSMDDVAYSMRDGLIYDLSLP